MMINGKAKIDPKDKRLARIIAVQAIYASEIYPENSNDIFSIQNYILKIQDLLDLKNKNELIKYVKDLHNADIADVIQNLNEDHRSQFILIVKDFLTLKF